MKGKVLLSSYGFTLNASRELLDAELKKDGDLSDKLIFLFFEPYDSIQEMIVKACQEIGFKAENILVSNRDAWPEDRCVDYVFVGEGNTFESMRILRDKGLFERIRKACQEEGATYLGASAGAVIAGKNISCARVLDEEGVRLEDWEKEGLGLIDGIVFPHTEDLEELSGIDLSQYLGADGKEVLTPYVIANDGILTFAEKE